MKRRIALIALLIVAMAASAQTKLDVSGDTLFVTVGKTNFRMILVEAGDFVMGAFNLIQECHDEVRMHKVFLTEDYYIAETEVTQSLWLEVTSENPSVFSGEQRPVDNVSWDLCMKFIEKLNEYTGMRFRMPTEAEWEYAARGGKKSHGYLYCGGDAISGVAWYKYNSHFGTHIVRRRACNELGLYDMTGNVWEFCSDWYAPEYDVEHVHDPKGPVIGERKVSRGGAWDNDTVQCRITYRNPCAITLRGNGLGLRLAISAKDVIKFMKNR